MFDTTEELFRQVALGEDSLLELKGVVFRGKRIDAPDKLDLLETWVRDICLDRVDPSLDCLIRRVPLEGGKGVLRVDVPQSLFVHNFRGMSFSVLSCQGVE